MGEGVCYIYVAEGQINPITLNFNQTKTTVTYTFSISENTSVSHGNLNLGYANEWYYTFSVKDVMFYHVEGSTAESKKLKGDSWSIYWKNPAVFYVRELY